jgi:F-type H+-transporting ATPase subunit c
MRKVRILFFSLMSFLLLSVTAFAQTAEEVAKANASSVETLKYKAIAAGIGFAIAAGLGALGQGKVAAAAAEGAARNPGAAARIQTIMILGLALIESLVLFALLVVFVKL